MKTNIRKVAVAGMMTAIAVALSGFSIPIGASRCFPIQHMMNVLAAGMEISEEDLRQLRARCVREVKQTNGNISLKDAVKYQKGQE